MKLDPKFSKLLIVINCSVPGAIMIYDAFRHQLGVNPVEFALRTTGLLALIFLLLTLCITPLRRLINSNFPSHFRRTLGLYAFWYALAHMMIYFIFDRSLDLNSTIEDIINRPFILLGSLSLLLLIPLAVTSTNGMIKRLGAKRWKMLHKLVYLCAILGVVHYYLLVKADKFQPTIFAIVLCVLLAYRLLPARKKPARLVTA